MFLGIITASAAHIYAATQLSRICDFTKHLSWFVFFALANQHMNCFTRIKIHRLQPEWVLSVFPQMCAAVTAVKQHGGLWKYDALFMKLHCNKIKPPHSDSKVVPSVNTNETEVTLFLNLINSQFDWTTSMFCRKKSCYYTFWICQ